MPSITTQTIRVDLNTGKTMPRAFIHQNDTRRTLVFNMYLNGSAFDMTGCTVKFAYQSPIVNGKHFVITGADMADGTVSGNTVTVTLSEKYTVASGVGMLTMVITPSTGTIRPVNIILVVQKSADGLDSIASASDFPTTLEGYVADWLDGALLVKKNWAEYSEYPIGTKVGMMEDKRYNSSGALVDTTGHPTLYASGYIPILSDTTVSFDGLDLSSSSSRYGNTFIFFYNSSRSVVASYSGSMMDGSQHTGFEVAYSSGTVKSIKYVGDNASSVAYIAVCACLTSTIDDVSIYTNVTSSNNYVSVIDLFREDIADVHEELEANDSKLNALRMEIVEKKDWAEYAEYPLGTVFGVVKNKRYNSSGALVGTAESSSNPLYATGYIPFKKGETLTISGFNLSSSSAKAGNTYIFIFSSSLGVIASITGSMMNGEQQDGWELTYRGGVINTVKYTGSSDAVAYLGLSGLLTGSLDDVHITSDSSDDDNYLSLSDSIDQMGETLNDFRTEMQEWEEAIRDEEIIIPSYWESSVASAVATVKNQQKVAGYNGVCFNYFSDAHVWHTDPYAHNVGILSAYMMRELNIPLTVLTGDGFTNAAAETREIAQQCIDKLQDILSDIPADGFLYVKGNHEYHYGNEVIDGTQQYYFRSLSMGEEWENLGRRQSGDFRRVMGHDGTYFYIDNIPQKTRFLCLNNYRTDFTIDSNGIPTCDAFHNGKGYGQQQLDFAIDALQSLESGWSVVFFMHCPPGFQDARDSTFFNGIVTAFCNRSTFSGSYTDPTYSWATSSVNVDFTNANGTAIAVFCGHIHKDTIDTTTLPIPIITITCATNSSYNSENENPSTRTLNSDTETAMDTVVINKATRTIYLTRLGVTTNGMHNSSKVRSVTY